MRNSFKTPLIVEVMPGGKRFKLHFAFTYLWHYKNGSTLNPILKIKIVVPAGFVTDFASIPQPFHWFISKLGRYNKAGVLHDWLYQYGHSISRKMADQCFLDAMTELDVSKWKRTIMYWSVRICGKMAWRDRE